MTLEEAQEIGRKNSKGGKLPVVISDRSVHFDGDIEKIKSHCLKNKLEYFDLNNVETKEVSTKKIIK